MEVILIPQFDPNKFDELLLENKPNHMVGVPSHYGNIIHSKNKNYSYNTDTVKSIEISKQVDTQ